MIRLVSELAWAARRAGLVIAPPKVADLARAFAALDWSRPDDLRLAARAVLAESSEDAAKLDGVFARFFDPGALGANDLAGRVLRLGLSPRDVAAILRAASAEGDAGAAVLLGLLEGPYVTERLLSRQGREVVQTAAGAAQLGFLHAELREALGLPRAERDLAKLRPALSGAFGPLGEALARLFADELALANDELRTHLAEILDAPREVRRAVDKPFSALSDEEDREVQRAMAELAKTLRGAARTRARRRRAGRLDPAAVRREAERTLGVPVRLPKRRRERDKPRLFVLVDVSDSVRPAARTFLAVATALSDLFRETRVFAFVREVEECTALVRTPEGRAAVVSGDLVDASALSSYERAFESFARRHVRDLDRRATVVVLGDGRTNRAGAGLAALRRIRDASREVLFLTSDPRSAWGTGDSEMPRIAKAVGRVVAASTPAELGRAVRELVRRS